MKISIITAVLNNQGFIEQSILSVLNQTYPNIEYIVIDGKSNDGTERVIQKHSTRISKIISEADNGIYEALNKGIAAATGDVVGFLHSDDIYAEKEVLENVATVFQNDESLDSCYGNALCVKRNDLSHMVRYWKSSPYDYDRIKHGWMPPHVAFFVRKRVYDKYGTFDTDYKICGDYELILRFLYRYRISTRYISSDIVRMRMGGASTRSLKAILRKNWEGYKACKSYGLGFSTIVMKNLIKIQQLFNKGVFSKS